MKHLLGILVLLAGLTAGAIEYIAPGTAQGGGGSGGGGGAISNAYNLTFQKNTAYTNATAYYAEVSQTFKSLPNTASTPILSFYVDTNADGVWDVININQTFNLGIAQEISVPFGGPVPPGAVFIYTNNSGTFTTLSPYTNSGNISYTATNGASGGSSGISLTDATNAAQTVSGLSGGVYQLSGVPADYRQINFWLADNLRLPFLNPLEQLTTLNPGTNLIHAMIYVIGQSSRYVFAATRNYPTVLFRFNADNLTDYSTVTFANDGKHDFAAEIVHAGTNVYLTFNGGGSNTYVSAINVETLAVTDLVNTNGMSTSGDQSMTTDGRYLYVTKDFGYPGQVGKFDILDGHLVATNMIYWAVTNYAGRTGHAALFDGHDVYISGFVNNPASQVFSWLAKIATNDLSVTWLRTFNNNTNAAALFHSVTDDIADVGEYIYMVSESGDTNKPSQLLRVSKTDSNAFDFIDTGLTNYGAYAIYYDGRNIWVPYLKSISGGGDTNDTIMLRLDPQTFEIKHFAMHTNAYLLNELVGDGTRMFFSTYQSRTTVQRMSQFKEPINTIWDASYGTNAMRVAELNSTNGLTIHGTLRGINPAYATYGAIEAGYQNTASGLAATAVGQGNVSSGTAAFSSGSANTASGLYSFVAGGSGSTASAIASFVEGTANIASGNNSHAAGNLTYAYGSPSHADGQRAAAAANRTYIWNGNIASYKTNSTAGSFQVNAPSGINLLDSAITGNGASITNINLSHPTTYFTNAAGTKFIVIVNSSTNGFTFTAIP